MPIPQADKLKPLYQKLLEATPSQAKDLCTFFPQAGKNYLQAPCRILVVGKAVNGWCKGSTDSDIETLFSPEGIVNRPDEMIWINKLWQSTQSNKYNTRKSAFWRVIKGVSTQVCQKEDWWNWIAWNNLYKRAPSKGGNPSAKLRKGQLNLCKEILEKEIKFLNPNIIIFFTSGWENPFLAIETPSQEIIWGKYRLKKFQYQNRIYIQTVHPQGKNEKEHIEHILSLINQSRKD